MTTPLAKVSSANVAGEIRAELARQSLTRAQLATRLSSDLERPISVDWLSRRLSGTVDLTLEDAAAIADALEVSLLDWLRS